MIPGLWISGWSSRDDDKEKSKTRFNIDNEVKPEPLDDDTEDFLPSKPTQYKVRTLEF